MTPTPETLAQALVARFARGKPEDLDLSSHDWYVREITTALTEQAQGHPDCHPAALCDGPEQARQIERLTKLNRDQRFEDAKQYTEIFDKAKDQLEREIERLKVEVQAGKDRWIGRLAEGNKDGEIRGLKIRLSKKDAEIEMLRSEAGYHDARAVIEQLTAQRDTIQRATWEAAAKIGRHIAEWNPTMSERYPASYWEGQRDGAAAVVTQCEVRARAAAQGGRHE